MKLAWLKSVVLAIVAAMPAFGVTEAQQGVTFEFSYVVTQNRIEPNPMNNITALVRGSVTLSGRNQVSGGLIRSGLGQSGGPQDTQSIEGQLGGRWRVIDANTLQFRNDLPQSVVFITLRTRGGACTVDVEFRLKPGFRNHKFGLIGRRGQWGLFDVIGIGQKTCTVRQ